MIKRKQLLKCALCDSTITESIELSTGLHYVCDRQHKYPVQLHENLMNHKDGLIVSGLFPVLISERRANPDIVKKKKTISRYSDFVLAQYYDRREHPELYVCE